MNLPLVNIMHIRDNLSSKLLPG